MKIQSANLKNYSNNTVNNRTSFGHKSAYIFLKDIRGNHCACCGNELIPSSDISVAWSRITRPLAEVLKEGYFDKLKIDTPDVYKLLLNYAKHYPDESLDGIISVPANHYELMSVISKSFTGDTKFASMSGMAQSKEIKSRLMGMLQASSAIMKDSFEVMKNLEPLERYLYGYRKDVFKELDYLSHKFPNKKLNEILKLEEVRTPFIENTYFEAVEFAKTRDEHWNKANKFILDKFPKLERPLVKLHADICTIYRGLIDPKMVAYRILEAYKNFIDKYKLNDIKEPVMAEISQMPTSLFSKNSFLSYARRYNNDGVIVDYTIKSFMETIEHILAVSQGGSNDTKNIIMMCKNCNHNRKNIPYSHQVKIHPEMIENAENQIRFYGDKILRGEIPSILENYPIEVSQTLYQYSNGAMNYDLNDYIQALARKHAGVNP